MYDCMFEVEDFEYYKLRKSIPLLKSLEESIPDKIVYTFPDMIVIDGKRQSGKTTELLDIYNKYKDEYKIAFVTRSLESCKMFGISDCYTYNNIESIRGKKYDLILFDDVNAYEDLKTIKKISSEQECKVVISSTMRIVKRFDKYIVEGFYFSKTLWDESTRPEAQH